MNNVITTIKGRCNAKNITRLVFLLSIFSFCLLPLILLLFNIKGNDLSYVFKDKNFYSALGSSLLYTFISALLSTFLALFTAYFLNRANIRWKKIYVLFLSISMLVPTLSIGLGFRVLFGTNGFLERMLGIQVDGVGYLGLILGSVVISFPATFLVLYDALRYENKSPYDAASIMGIRTFSTFFKVTLPYLKKPLITAFFACFTLIFADYGIPMELAGKVKTLPMYLYEQINATFKYGRGALIGIFLLIPAVTSFIVDLFLKEDHSDDAQSAMIPRQKKFNIVAIVFIVGVILFLAIPQISFTSLAFMKGYPNNIKFTFDNIANIFSTRVGVGIITYIVNSITIALLTGILGTVLVFVIAYFSTRISGKLGKILHFASIASIAIPGIVLGVGYIFLFKGTNGFFYGTMAILVAVNIIHFMGSPYLMARNSFMKMNKDYEIVGDTLGISKLGIFFKVLVPNSIGTLVEMFSYFFLNSMITISAVAFLCTYKNQPLSILITTYEKTGNYEMQAVVSITILFINVLFKGIITILNHFINKRNNRKLKDDTMELNRYQFELLTYLDRHGVNKYSQRTLSDDLAVSLGTINKELNFCMDSNFIQMNANGELSVTEEGYKVLEPYKVKKAIILAAGFGSRMAPVTLDTPKPLVKVNGVRIIDTLLDSLVGKGITNIIIVRGYKKEKFDELLEKYPFIKFVDNPDYNVTNNISSLMKVLEYLDNCYICEADLVISNPDLVRKYEYTSNYLGAKVNETDDWCFHKKGLYIDKFQMGGENCYQTYGISYWCEADCKKLKEDAVKVYNSRAGKENFWDNIALKVCKKNYKIEIRKCHKADIIEIDNFSELVALDESYANYPGHENY